MNRDHSPHFVFLPRRNELRRNTVTLPKLFVFRADQIRAGINRFPGIEGIKTAFRIRKYDFGHAAVEAFEVHLILIQTIPAFTHRRHHQLLFRTRTRILPGPFVLRTGTILRSFFHLIDITFAVFYRHWKNRRGITVVPTRLSPAGDTMPRFDITDNLTARIRHFDFTGRLVKKESAVLINDKISTQVGFRDAFHHITRMAAARKNIVHITHSAFCRIVNRFHHTTNHSAVGIDIDIIESHFKRRISQKRNMHITITRKKALAARHLLYMYRKIAGYKLVSVQKLIQGILIGQIHRTQHPAVT